MRPWFLSHLSLNKEQASSLVAALFTAFLLGTTMLRLRTRAARSSKHSCSWLVKVRSCDKISAEI